MIIPHIPLRYFKCFVSATVQYVMILKLHNKEHKVFRKQQMLDIC